MYREAVTTSSPTLPLGGYVGFRRVEEAQPHRGLRRIGIRFHRGRDGNPGLEGTTASR
jgi:hypothetical protein